LFKSLNGLFRKKSKPNVTKKSEPFSKPNEVSSGIQLYMVSELGKALYQIEHILLRNQFFSDPKKLVAAISNGHNLFELFQYVMGKINIKIPYDPSDFVVHLDRVTPGIDMLILTLPTPEYTPLCHRIYLLFDSEFKNLSYYTVECGIDTDYLCMWVNDTHVNIQSIAKRESNKEEGFMLAIEAYIIGEHYKERFGLSEKDAQSEE